MSERLSAGMDQRVIDITVTDKSTRFVMISDIPVNPTDRKNGEEDFKARLRPTDLSTEEGMSIVHTEFGDLYLPILVWHAEWDHEEADIIPEITPMASDPR